MLHACATRFDVMGNLKNFVKFFGTKQDLIITSRVVDRTDCNLLLPSFFFYKSF